MDECDLSVHKPITMKEFERIVRSEKASEARKYNVLKKKDEVYYEVLTKFKKQCQSQYLNLVKELFANFLANLLTTMPKPVKLFQSYHEMQWSLLCYMLQCIGVESSENNKDGIEYVVCHKLSRAILSLIIKALDISSNYNPTDQISIKSTEYTMDNNIEDRMMRMAEKKVVGCKTINKP